MLEKIYRPLVIFLLFAIAGLLVIQALPPAVMEVSPECQAARNRLALTAELDIPVMSEYSEAVYNSAENINQQIFLATEFNFVSLQIIANQQSAILEWLASCN